jgi:hypothetical protein
MILDGERDLTGGVEFGFVCKVWTAGGVAGSVVISIVITSGTVGITIG